MSGEARQRLKNASADAAEEAKEGWSPEPGFRSSAYTAPGRLTDPRMELKDEPRINAKLAVLAAALGLDRNVPLPGLALVNEQSSLEEIAKMIGDMESAFGGLYSGQLPLDTPEDKNEPEIEKSEETIKGGDGQDMKVYIYRPKNRQEVLPGVIYTHGGGMTIISTMNPIHERWCKSIAIQGCVVVMPDFRNAFNRQGQHSHFPKGLNDCIAAAKWVSANRENLRINGIVLQGESGGGNLALATALSANRNGWIDEIAGVYAIVPYISNAYGWTEERMLRELPSLVENQGYFLNAHVNAFLGYFYTPSDEHMNDPLAWPYYATLEDMKGLSPHILCMDELDGLRDEGVSYARRLAKAGVKCKASVNLGVTHGSSLIWRNALPEYHHGAAREIAAFAQALAAHLPV